MTTIAGGPDPPDPPGPPDDAVPPPRGRPAVAARALAAAFLNGRWDPPLMARRGQRLLGERGEWVPDLARTVRHQFPDKPLDALRDLARFILACPQFREAVERREGRAWDIPFLLRPRVEMVANPFGVPSIEDAPALAAWLGVTVDHLDWFADRFSFENRAADERLRHYRRSWIRKADGSGRLLEAPKRELKDLQRMVLHGILDRIPPHPAAHGFTRKRSALTGARLHTAPGALLHLDLESFFTAVSAGRVFGIFRTAGYPEPVAHLLTALCTTTAPPWVRRQAPPASAAGAVERRRRMLAALAVAHLPQGSPTSPALANLAALRFDRRVTGLAVRFGATYTRYADDLTLSGDRPLIRKAGHIIATVEAIAADEGFRVNEAKTRVREPGPASARHRASSSTTGRTSPGPTTTASGRPPRRGVNGPAAANRQGHPDFRAHLLGRITWVAATNPARAGKLHAAFAAIRWDA